jgi:hypothetical protein
MQLSEQQKQTVRAWVTSGLSLSDVQKKLKGELGITLTFIDVRLLVLDLGAAVQDKPEPKPLPAKNIPEHVIEDEESFSEEDANSEIDDELQPQAPVPPEDSPDTPSSVSMTMDTLVVPGAMVSGDVTFSDGTKARWLIDQYGRFGVEPEIPGYRPSPPDLQAFQVLLRQELQRKGYA